MPKTKSETITPAKLQALEAQIAALTADKNDSLAKIVALESAARAAATVTTVERFKRKKAGDLKKAHPACSWVASLSRGLVGFNEMELVDFLKSEYKNPGAPFFSQFKAEFLFDPSLGDGQKDEKILAEASSKAKDFAEAYHALCALVIQHMDNSGLSLGKTDGADIRDGVRTLPKDGEAPEDRSTVGPLIENKG